MGPAGHNFTGMVDSQQITDLVDRLGRIAHAMQFAEGLNPAQWEALRFLARANRQSRSPGALAEYLGTTKGTASQTLIALETKGHVRRSRCATDRRSVTIDLTDQGRELAGRDPLDRIRQATAELSPEDCAALVRSMDHLMRTLQNDRGASVFGGCGDCSHNRSDGAFGETCRCALTGDMLATEELAQICIDFEAPA